MSKKINSVIALLTVGILLTACGQSETNTAPSEGTRTIFGTTQKGPFVKGTEITLYGMDENLHQTGAVFSTKIDNNEGAYSLKNISLGDRFAWLNANGYFIDEITGDTSDRKISLNSLVDLRKKDQVNINVLTHLSFNRVINLVESGKSVDEAKRQAEAEVLKAFGYSENSESFDQLDVLNNGDGDAKLLAISLIMLTAADMGEVTSRLANIAMDLETDGVWNDSALIRQLKGYVSMDDHNGAFKRVRENLVKMGAINIPDFQKYLKQFASPWDSTWEHCDKQDEVRRTTQFNNKLYSHAICRDGVWKYYQGPRDEGDALVDTTGKYGSFVDARDGRVYKTLDFKLPDGKTFTWMASLLEYEPQNVAHEDVVYIPDIGRGYLDYQILNYPAGEYSESMNLDDDTHNHVLYRDFVQGICPDGWHIPQDYEWEKLSEIIKDDYKMQELLVYLQYIDSDTESSLDRNKSGYYLAFENNFSLRISNERGFSVANIWSDGGSSSLYHGLRCVKN